MQKQTGEAGGDAANSDKDVLSVLQTATKGLLFPSESDKPVKAFSWKTQDQTAAITADTVKTLAKVPAGADVATVTLEDFFEPVTTKKDWFGADENAVADRFQNLVDTLKKHLTELSVFRVSDTDDTSRVTVYVVGRTSDNQLAGVTTQLIET